MIIASAHLTALSGDVQTTWPKRYVNIIILTRNYSDEGTLFV